MYARDTIDFLRALQARPAEAASLFVYTEDDARLFSDLLGRGRGVLLASGHYGNWELGGVAMSRVFQLPLTVVAMAEASEEVNRIRNDIRARLGISTIEVRRALDTALQIRRKLADNSVVALLMDRHMGRDRVPVTFFGQPAWFLRTPAQMAHLTGAPLVPCFIERLEGEGRFRIRPGTPIYVDTTLPREEAFTRATQAFADQLEASVRRRPELWYQFYRYWDAQRDAYGGLV
jgi:KDO2-lipid IV(A) lauroyltransferase